MKINFKNLNKTKIVCTIGLVSCDKKTLTDLAHNGMTVARINMSHGDAKFYTKVINTVRQINQESNGDLSVAVMTDTKGPEIRVGNLNKPLTIKAGSKVTIKTKSFVTPKTENTFYVYDSTKKYNMAKDLKAGNKILVDDGKLLLIANKVNAKAGVIEATAQNTHTIVTNKRLNLPDSHYTMPFISAKDKQDMATTAKLNADYIALSFVCSAQDIKDVRALMKKANKKCSTQLIAKIETQQALDNIQSIIKEADGIMIARGDLALETPYYDIPYWETEIIRLCKKAGKTVIVATQMLDSLEKNLQPTRAEVTDVYYAVYNGADATMLSGETASGQYPVQSVNTMATINHASEKYFDSKNHFKNVFLKLPFAESVKKTVKEIYSKLEKSAHPAFLLTTNDEKLIKAISCARLNSVAIITTSNKDLVTKFSASFGIKMYYDPKAHNTNKIMYL